MEFYYTFSFQSGPGFFFYRRTEIILNLLYPTSLDDLKKVDLPHGMYQTYLRKNDEGRVPIR